MTKNFLIVVLVAITTFLLLTRYQKQVNIKSVIDNPLTVCTIDNETITGVCLNQTEIKTIKDNL